MFQRLKADMTEPEDRDLAHEADMRKLMRQQLHDNISPEEAAEECAALDDADELLGDPDEYDYEDDDLGCPQCWGDGRDPDSDYLLPCPVCQGEQHP